MSSGNKSSRARQTPSPLVLICLMGNLIFTPISKADPYEVVSPDPEKRASLLPIEAKVDCTHLLLFSGVWDWLKPAIEYVEESRHSPSETAHFVVSEQDVQLVSGDDGVRRQVWVVSIDAIEKSDRIALSKLFSILNLLVLETNQNPVFSLVSAQSPSDCSFFGKMASVWGDFRFDALIRFSTWSSRLLDGISVRLVR
jgi:hypothetical protein